MEKQAQIKRTPSETRAKPKPTHQTQDYTRLFKWFTLGFINYLLASAVALNST
jgi:hypothetical protein